MKTNVTREHRSIGIDQSKTDVDLSHAAGRRVRIRELIQLHDSVTVGEIIQEMNRSVETNRSEIIGTLSGLERAGFVIILDAENMTDREVRLA
jgi:predicted transcriptional regulator